MKKISLSTLPIGARLRMNDGRVFVLRHRYDNHFGLDEVCVPPQIPSTLIVDDSGRHNYSDYREDVFVAAIETLSMDDYNKELSLVVSIVDNVFVRLQKEIAFFIKNKIGIEKEIEIEYGEVQMETKYTFDDLVSDVVSVRVNEDSNIIGTLETPDGTRIDDILLDESGFTLYRLADYLSKHK